MHTIGTKRSKVVAIMTAPSPTATLTVGSNYSITAFPHLERLNHVDGHDARYDDIKIVCWQQLH